MSIDVDTLKQIIARVIQDMGSKETSRPTPSVPTQGGTTTMLATAVGKLHLAETGPAERSSDPKEVVIALSPAFSSLIHETIIGLPHSEVLKEIAAGIEEEGCNHRFVKVYRSADVGFIAPPGREALRLRHRDRVAVAGHDGDPPEGPAAAEQRGTVQLVAAHRPGHLPRHRQERGQVRQGRVPATGADPQRPDGTAQVPGHRRAAAQQGNRPVRPGEESPVADRQHRLGER